VSADPAMRARAERIRQPLDLLVTEARTMVGSLRPPALGPSDFAGSMSLLVEGFRGRTGVASELELEGDFGPHTDSVRICLYRVAQEALSNAEKHSEATRVQVWARSGKGAVDLIVRDNGRGFDLDGLAPADGDHFGLLGMRERAEYLGGRLEIRSRPGEGTSVILHIPRYGRGGNGRE
jgi:signal transduction histidine kinase